MKFVLREIIFALEKISEGESNPFILFRKLEIFDLTHIHIASNYQNLVWWPTHQKLTTLVL